MFVQQFVQIDNKKIKGQRFFPFVRGIHRSPVDSLHKGTVTWKGIRFDDMRMGTLNKNTEFLYEKYI